MVHERDDELHCKCGFRQWQHDLPPKAKGAAAIHIGGILQLVGDRHEVLTHEEDLVGVPKEAWDDQWPERIRKIQPAEDHEARDDHDNAGQKKCAYDRVEDEFSTSEPQPGQCVSDERRDGYPEDHVSNDDGERVADIDSDIKHPCHDALFLEEAPRYCTIIVFQRCRSGDELGWVVE